MPTINDWTDFIIYYVLSNIVPINILHTNYKIIYYSISNSYCHIITPLSDKQYPHLE